MSLGLQPTLRFTRHYLEMLAAMFLGMGVLGAPALLACRPSKLPVCARRR